MQPAEENNPKPLLQAVRVHKQFGRKTVLSDIDLAIYPGEIVTVIGPNGSGKTTLLQLLLGLGHPSEGEIIQRPGLRIGYVPQSIHFDPIMPMTVQHMLQLFSQDKRRISLVAGELQIMPYMKRQLYALSGGELQRVMLAQALLAEPHLLVLDEPVQGVDFSSQAQLYRLIRKIARARHCAVLMVSHDLHMVMADTDKVICLNRHICCSGTPHGVSRDPEFISLFGQDVADQIALYVHHHDHSHNPHGEVVKEGECQHHDH